MTQKATKGLTAADLREYLATQDDFEFELEVYGRAKELDLSPRHAWTYEDPITNKVRQFDVRAHHTNGNCRVYLAIECKNLRDSYPLLVSRIPRAADESFHDLIYSDGVPAMYGSARCKRVSGGKSLYPPREQVGKSMRQVRRERKELISGDEVFDKWMQAAASADSLIKQALEYHRPNRAGYPLSLVLPILVVSDGALWAADYSENGTLVTDPTEVTDATFFMGRDYPQPNLQPTYTVSHLHIYTRSTLGNFLKQVQEPGAFWETAFRRD